MSLFVLFGDLGKRHVARDGVLLNFESTTGDLVLLLIGGGMGKSRWHIY